MKHRKTALTTVSIGTLALVLSGCGKDNNKPNSSHQQHDHSSMVATEGMQTMQDPTSGDDTLYQCSMHPNVVSDKPGYCPICAMDLQPVQAIDVEGIAGRAPVRLTDKQRQLINIRVSRVESNRAIKKLHAPGIIEHDASKVFTISAWTPGRIEKLHVNKEETFVENGDVLYEIYSPELYAAMQEYVSLLNGPLKQDTLIESARVRLVQIGLRNEQIDELAKTGKAPLTIPIKSPTSGIVMKKMIREGGYVKEGDTLYTIVDLSELWLIAEVYEADLPFVSPGQKVAATTPAVPGETFLGTVELINHHIDPKTRTAKLRIIFDSSNQTMRPVKEGESHRHHRLLPDMWMTARIEKDLGNRLAIPRRAVFDTGRRQYVFVESEEGLFVPKEIEVGPRIEDRVLVDSGLEEGEWVVTDGTFLLDSESLLKASATGNTDAGESTASIAQKKGDESTEKAAGFPGAATEAFDGFWTAYLELREALARDSLETARPLFETIRDQAKSLGDADRLPAVGKPTYLNALDGIQSEASLANDADLAAARAQFGRLSKAIIDWASNAPEVVTLDLNVASCPMWTASPAQWIQRGDEIENPFMGSAMLQCGAIENILAEGNGR